MKRLVSIIIPVYNAETSIESTLNSVAAQTYTNWELIIVNDGATDGSHEKITRFLESSDLTKNDILYFVQDNAGVSKARNEGMKRAKGDFIALLDSDDQWLPSKLEEQLVVMQEHPEVDLLSTNRNGEHYDGFLGSKFDILVPISSKRLMLKNFLLTPTVLFKSEVLTSVGYFNEQMKHCEDLEFFIRISNTYNCYLLNKSLVITGDGKPSFGHSGLSAALWKMEQGELQNIKMSRNEGILNYPEYISISAFSFLKYIRRSVITSLRNKKH